MGTDVNPVAWENAELMAYALTTGDDNKLLADYLIKFGSILDVNKHGDHGVSGGQEQGVCFRVGANEFVFTGEQKPYVRSLTKILYEVFYKHQS